MPASQDEPPSLRNLNACRKSTRLQKAALSDARRKLDEAERGLPVWMKRLEEDVVAKTQALATAQQALEKGKTTYPASIRFQSEVVATEAKLLAEKFKDQRTAQKEYGTYRNRSD